MSELPSAADNDRTLLPGMGPDSGSEPVRGNALSTSSQNGLPVGTRLGEFEITSLIGEGGFGIVYLVHDHSLQRNVALKEYMPTSFAGRLDGLTVAVRSERHADTFAAGLRSFINEARLLAQFDHPSLLKIYRFWEANGTGYFVMPYYDGSITLKQALLTQADPPSEAWLQTLLAQLLDALEVLHGAQCFHRDISPDNILLLKDGRPLLLDFGSARRVIGDMTQALTVFLKPGYAPMEQYAEEPALKQGPWTDLYALAAVVYFAITGRPPMPSVARMVSDTLVPAAKAGAGRYSPAFLQAIDAALSVRPEHRPQSVAEFRRLLANESGSFGNVRVDASRASESGATGVSETRPRPWLRRAIIGGAAGVAVLGGGLWWWYDEQDRAVTSAPAPVTTQESRAAPIQVPSTSAGLPAGSPRPSVEGATAGVATPASPPSPERAYEPRQALADVHAARSLQHPITVSVAKSRINFNRREAIGFSVSSTRPGFVYVFEVGVEAGGKSSLLLLFPNGVDRDNRIGAGAPMTLPRETWPLVAGGPAGINHFLVIVSDNERDFADLGMRKIGREGYGEFPSDVAAQFYRTHTGASPLFAGKVKCQPGAQACSEAYGAAEFFIEEVDR